MTRARQDAQQALQRQAVTVLLAYGATPVEVAAQLAASAVPGDKAAVHTLREAARTLAGSDPSTAADLSRRALELANVDDPVRGSLAAQTALLLHSTGRIGEGKAFADAGTTGPSHSSAKPTVVLVHGAWADGSSWSDVVKRLQPTATPSTWRPTRCAACPATVTT